MSKRRWGGWQKGKKRAKDNTQGFKSRGQNEFTWGLNRLGLIEQVPGVGVANSTFEARGWEPEIHKSEGAGQTYRLSQKTRLIDCGKTQMKERSVEVQKVVEGTNGAVNASTRYRL